MQRTANLIAVSTVCFNRELDQSSRIPAKVRSTEITKRCLTARGENTSPIDTCLTSRSANKSPMPYNCKTSRTLRVTSTTHTSPRGSTSSTSANTPKPYVSPAALIRARSPIRASITKGTLLPKVDKNQLLKVRTMPLK